MEVMNICFVGLGSIAKRHITNINKIFKSNNQEFKIDCFRSSMNEIPDEIKSIINNVYYNFEDVPEDYDVIFITNPTSLHLETIRRFKNNAKHFFIEKPLFDKAESFLELKDLKLNKDSVFYVACPLRYTKVIQYLKTEIDFSKVYSIRCISSSYLPDWRPNIDYRKTYSAHKDMGGGVSIDLIHEWDYLYYLIGKPKKVWSIINKISDLEIDSDDIAVYIAEYDNKTVELHLDYFGRETIREIEIFSRDETIIGDLISGKILYKKSNKVIDLTEQRNDFQIRELEYFFEIIKGNEPNTNNLEAALNVLMLTGGKN